MTLHEHYSLKQNPTKSPHETNPLDTLKGLKVSWIGDCNNVWCSLLLNLPKFGIEFTTANPKGYEPIPKMVELSEKLTPHKIDWNTFNDPLKAIKGSDVLITDTW
jgi:ornithine carbamoyltransferase